LVKRLFEWVKNTKKLWVSPVKKEGENQTLGLAGRAGFIQYAAILFPIFTLIVSTIYYIAGWIYIRVYLFSWGIDANLYPLGVFDICLQGLLALYNAGILLQGFTILISVALLALLLVQLNIPKIKTPFRRAVVDALLIVAFFQIVPLIALVFTLPASREVAINDHLFDLNPSAQTTNSIPPRTEMAKWKKTICLQVKSMDGESEREEFRGRQLIASKDFLSILVQEPGMKPRAITFPQSEVLRMQMCPEVEEGTSSGTN